MRRWKQVTGLFNQPLFVWHRFTTEVASWHFPKWAGSNQTPRFIYLQRPKLLRHEQHQVTAERKKLPLTGRNLEQNLEQNRARLWAICLVLKLCPVQQHDLTSISMSESSCLCSFIYIYSNSLNMFSFREGIKVWSDMNWWWNKSRWQQRISGIRDLLSWRLSSICVWLVCFRLRFSRSFSLHFFC